MQKTITKFPERTGRLPKANNRVGLFIMLLVFFGISQKILSQVTYTFTTAGATGMNGPTQSQINTAYASTNLNGAVTVNAGVQSWTVPASGLYKIETAGAQGGATGGNGARMIGEFNLTQGHVLQIVVGQEGLTVWSEGGGGGGSFVYNSTSALLYSAAGGGGGGANNSNTQGQITTTARDGHTTGSYSGIYAGKGGINGGGGGAGSASDNSTSGGNGGNGSDGFNTNGTSPNAGAGGAGFLGNGGNTYNNEVVGGKKWVNNMVGGNALYTSSYGGFGGGGAGYSGCGGGGGYSGGGGGAWSNDWAGAYGGGGGSFNGGSNQVNTAGVNTGDGMVKITVLNASALHFDGANDFINASDPNFGTNNFTIEGWFKANGTAGHLLTTRTSEPGGGGNWWTIHQSGTGLAMELAECGVAGTYSVISTPTNIIANGVWFHLAVVRSGVVYKVYVNGTLQTTFTDGFVRNFVTGSNIMRFGGWPNFNAGWYNGSMDDIRIWNTARTQCEINTYKDCEIATTAAGLVRNYHFNQGFSGANNAGITTLTDAANSNNGTLFNFALNGTTSNWIAPGGVVSGSVTPAALIPTVTASPVSTTICNGQTALLTGGGASTYTWTGGISNAIAFSPTITATYTVTGSNTSGCTNTAIATVNVNNCTPAAALNFDGVNDVVNINPVLSGNFTIEFWTKTTVTGPTGPNWYNGIGMVDSEVGGQANDYGVSLVGSKACFGIGNPDLSIMSTSNINTGNWVHIAATWRQSTGEMRLYVNGVLEATATGATAARSTPAIRLGAMQTFITYFNGNLDELRLWNTVRTQCEINTYKNCEIPTSSTGLAANYHFNQGYSAVNNAGVTTLSDASGNANNGTLVNFALSGSTSNWTAPGGVVTGSVTPAALPVVTANTSTSAVCAGKTVTLTGGGANTYTWSGGVSNGVSFAPANTATYTVVGTNAASGCTNSAVTSVTVNALPVVTANASNTVICNGQSITLTGGGATTYTWTGGATNGVAFAPANTATYTVTGTNAVTGCTNTAIRSVTVNALPVVTANASPTVICNGQTTILNGSGADTYTWTGGASNGVAFAPANTATYSVSGTNTLTGCTSTNNAAATVSVNPLPVVTVISTTTVLCFGSSATLSGAGADTYTWTGGINDGVAFSPLVTDSYTVTGTNTLTGCSNTAVESVSVNPLPVVTAAITNSVICEGASTTVNGGGADTYTWTGGVTDGVAFTPLISESYTVTGTNTLTGCTSTNIAVASVAVNTLPIVTASITNSVICEGASTTLNGGGADTYTWTGGVNDGVAFTPLTSGSYTVTGTNTLTGCTSTNVAVESVTVNTLPVIVVNDGVVCAGNSFTIVASGAATYTYSSGSNVTLPVSNESYTVTGTSAAGCTSTNSAVSSVTVNPLPVVLATSNTSLICVGQTVTLTASGATSYTWSTNAVSVSISDSPTVTTTYTVTGEDANGCMNSAAITQSVDACTGIRNIAAMTASIKVYPNPSSNQITVELNSEATVIIMNSLGAILSSEKMNSGSNTVDVSKFVNGIYFVNILQNGGTKTVKLIKH